MNVYSAQEQRAARIVASLIYPDYPGGPDLESDPAQLGLYESVVRWCRDPYERAAITMPLDGILRDCHGDAATVWEGLRQMSGAATPYAQIEPLIRELGGATRARAVNGREDGHGGGVDYRIDPRREGITLAELQHKQFAAERWIIEGILPEGACLFAAKYKSKKSWLSLAIGLAISMGGRAIGRLAVEQGDVLYLDLEGRQQRIQKRTRAMLGVRQTAWPDNFHIYTAWSQADEGLIDLEHWLMAHPRASLIVIDVLASFRRPMQQGEEFYRYDRDTVDPINALAEKYHVAIVLVHHFNKAKHDDIMDSITGSTGLPSAVNTMWGLRRDVNDSSIQVLELRGRDLENEEPLALKWDSYLNQHIIEGQANEVATSAERRAVLKVMSDDEPRTPKDIATTLGKPVTAVQQLMRKLVNDGLIDKVGWGKYAIVRRADQTDQTDQTDQSDQSDQSLSTPTLIGNTDSDRQIDHRSESRSELATAVGSGETPLNTSIMADSDRSDRYSNGGVAGLVERLKKVKDPFNGMAQADREQLQLYLRSNMDSDQEIARARCAAYGIDYDQARKDAR